MVWARFLCFCMSVHSSILRSLLLFWSMLGGDKEFKWSCC
ncbi:hypothetical protein OIU79_001840 [Salix purpurea]|uniref:Uncharacterized protein n=1 Tax=Salix purpurea TaxID=77065 RepID=A0A9Q0ZHH6_SALPP|nr:hypothetical protein OIU79_001840 [Salix purpurea]